ncbi:hypothetical protein Spb1_24010 [Planctopirus ephydatiae]|uniref:Cytochrome c domain-containing protein n=1 Tax=Planctopirus ephydatiae TaxID=2528019 RepID=A0A518GPC7_9PLAN|nr:prenyltransferase/squalene oxidase repeat-containing protein [Planctopirus ephydatiae]QDV30467.1 hypothetical protein Spb1_24010 [Planctopirus ephydatiae]
MKPTLRIIALLLVGLSLVCPAAEPSKAVVRFQYRSGDIAIPAATANEPRVESFGADSLRLAARYLDEGALAWTRERSCMACHTTGVYLAERPALTQFFGPPLQEVRASFIAEVPVDPTAAEPHGFLVWRALGLAKWDEHVAETVSEPTDRALRHMLRRLPEDGLFDTVSKVEIPYTTTEFELTVQAARALAAAPGWLAGLTDPELAERVARLQAALAAHRPRNDYERVLQLQLATIMPELVPQATRDAAITMLRGKQHPDGGWSTRDLSAVENWGDQIRPDNIAMLLAEPDADHPTSDAYLTAFAIILLRENNVPATDPAIQRGLNWLKAEQRVSGRWWMKSLYRPTAHFSTYIATAHALRAFALCGDPALVPMTSLQSTEKTKPLIDTSKDGSPK